MTKHSGPDRPNLVKLGRPLANSANPLGPNHESWSGFDQIWLWPKAAKVGRICADARSTGNLSTTLAHIWGRFEQLRSGLAGGHCSLRVSSICSVIFGQFGRSGPNLVDCGRTRLDSGQIRSDLNNYNSDFNKLPWRAPGDANKVFQKCSPGYSPPEGTQEISWDKTSKHIHSSVVGAISGRRSQNSANLGQTLPDVLAHIEPNLAGFGQHRPDLGETWSDVWHCGSDFAGSAKE